jgi:hypothetical protein
MDHALLFAQAAIEIHEPTSPALGWLVLDIGAVLGFIAVVIAGVTLRNVHLANQERMRVLELGYMLPRRASRWPQALFCTVVGAGVPMGMYLITWLISTSMKDVGVELWIGPCIVSVAAIVGATIVAGISFGRTEPSAQAEQINAPSMKPAHDPEALDFAGRMGHG